jgi:hypothetical protein
MYVCMYVCMYVFIQYVYVLRYVLYVCMYVWLPIYLCGLFVCLRSEEREILRHLKCRFMRATKALLEVELREQENILDGIRENIYRISQSPKHMQERRQENIFSTSIQKWMWGRTSNKYKLSPTKISISLSAFLCLYPASTMEGLWV